MAGLGTVINCLGVILGGVLGIFFQRGLKERFQDILLKAVGISVIFIGLAGALEGIFFIEEGLLKSSGTMMIIISLVVGSLLGELINIEEHTRIFGAWIRTKTNNSKDARFIDAFVTSSLTICVGAMAVVGSIRDGISGDISLLCAKAILDAVIVFVLASSLGKGCIFSVIPLGLLQGSITLLARVIEPVLTPQAISNISAVGSILITCVGINIMFDTKIKVANMLPSLIIAGAYAFLPV